MITLLNLTTQNLKDGLVKMNISESSLSTSVHLVSGQLCTISNFIGASLSEPHTHETASPAIYLSIYLSMYVIP